MSVLYSGRKDNFVSHNAGLNMGEQKPPLPTPPEMVKKSTMYIIVALSIVVTSMMFASTVTVVYLISRGENSGTGDQAGTTAPAVSHELGPVTTEKTSSQSQASGSSLTSTVTTFTRWGKTECTSSSEIIYTGYTAGSRYNYYGGTSNVLCLPNEPQYENTYPGMSGSYVYGSEYNAGNANLRALFGKNLLEQDIPCALCEVTGSSAMMMFPARTECYDGWKKQYSGYLMTSHEAYNKSMDIVCMDSDPEMVPDSSANNNGALFYFVEANGQILLPKGTYSEGFELTCVVCTK